MTLNDLQGYLSYWWPFKVKLHVHTWLLPLTSNLLAIAEFHVQLRRQEFVCIVQLQYIHHDGRSSRHDQSVNHRDDCIVVYCCLGSSYFCLLLYVVVYEHHCPTDNPRRTDASLIIMRYRRRPFHHVPKYTQHCRSLQARFHRISSDTAIDGRPKPRTMTTSEDSGTKWT